MLILFLIVCGCLPDNNRCLERIGDKYINYSLWYKKWFGEDTPFWFVMLIIREILEFIVQTAALFYYNGYNILDRNDLVLAYRPKYVLLFAMVLGSNGLTVGALWVLYVVKYSSCHGLFFKEIVFVTDTIFDTFYAIFPLLIVAIQNDFQLSIAVGALQANDLYVILSISFLLWYVNVLLNHFQTNAKTTKPYITLYDKQMGICGNIFAC